MAARGRAEGGIMLLPRSRTARRGRAARTTTPRRSGTSAARPRVWDPAPGFPVRAAPFTAPLGRVSALTGYRPPALPGSHRQAVWPVAEAAARAVEPRGR